MSSYDLVSPVKCPVVLGGVVVVGGQVVREGTGGDPVAVLAGGAVLRRTGWPHGAAEADEDGLRDGVPGEFPPPVQRGHWCPLSSHPQRTGPSISSDHASPSQFLCLPCLHSGQDTGLTFMA